MKPHLTKRAVSPVFHFVVNVLAAIWLVIADLFSAEIQQFATQLATTLGVEEANVAVWVSTAVILAQWIPIIGIILFDHGTNVELYAALKEYNGLVQAGINEARGRVTGDIGLISKEEKERIFSDMESYQLKTVRDTFGLLRREVLIAFLTLLPWISIVAAHYAPAFPTLPDQLLFQASFLAIVKFSVFVYWTSVNFRLRFVHLKLFDVT